MHQVLDTGSVSLTRFWPQQLLSEAWGAYAFRRFGTPSLSAYRTADHEQLVERARFHLRRATPISLTADGTEVQAYEFLPDAGTEIRASVLMVHGWTGEASFMCAFAEHFRRRGFRVVLADMPAHGQSAGKRTTLIACARAVRDVADALGPFQFAVAHSVGGLAALLVGEGGPPLYTSYPFAAYVLVSVPHRFADVTARFGAELGLSTAAQESFERRLEQLAERRIAGFTGADLLAGTGRPALILHSRDDDAIPFADAQEIAALCSTARLQAVDGLGHRNILLATPVVRQAADFLLGQLAVNKISNSCA